MASRLQQNRRPGNGFRDWLEKRHPTWTDGLAHPRAKRTYRSHRQPLNIRKPVARERNRSAATVQQPDQQHEVNREVSSHFELMPVEIVDLICDKVLTLLQVAFGDYACSSYVALNPWRNTCRHFRGILSTRIWERVVVTACQTSIHELQHLVYLLRSHECSYLQTIDIVNCVHARCYNPHIWDKLRRFLPYATNLRDFRFVYLECVP
jgi:hypothetical protein